ncbi:type IV pilin [Haloarcula litorea]|uniref:type IV pilin n=1 Tax=Haloarcula litorea TaxID=3032579 RepID=UPI0023E8E704|nr:type IV pilin [Halomicroarcula sp. GDY20]
MQGQSHLPGQRGLSPVVGVVLLIGITMLLAATTATVLFGLGEDARERATPQAAFDFDYDASGADALAITHASGDTVTAGRLSVVVRDATAAGDPNGRYPFEQFGSLGASAAVAAGHGVTVTGATPIGVSDLDLSGATVAVVWHAPNDRRTVTLSSWTGPRG